MSAIQRFILAIVPRSIGQAIEKESRQWMLHCGECSQERSVWEVGGIRYLACGNKWIRRRCPHCQHVSWLKVYKKD